MDVLGAQANDAVGALKEAGMLRVRIGTVAKLLDQGQTIVRCRKSRQTTHIFASSKHGDGCTCINSTEGVGDKVHSFVAKHLALLGEHVSEVLSTFFDCGNRRDYIRHEVHLGLPIGLSLERLHDWFVEAHLVGPGLHVGHLNVGGEHDWRTQHLLADRWGLPG